MQEPKRDSKRKLLISTPYFPPNIGGLQRYSFEMAKHARLSGYDVVVVTSGEERKVYEIEDIKVYQLPTSFKISNTPIGTRWFYDLQSIIKYESPDVINTHTPVPFMSDLTVRAAGNIPVVVTYHSGSMKKHATSIFNFPIHFYEKFILPGTLKRADRIICASSFVANDFLALYSAKNTVITPGVDTEIFKPGKRKEGSKRVLFVGNYTYDWKGLDYLKAAMRGINANLHIVGIGTPGNESGVIYEGPLSGQELVEAYQSADVMVLPSTTESESFGMVLIEAMACGVPVVGSNIGGIPTIIRNNENGLLAVPADSDDLHETIEHALKDRESSKERSAVALKEVHERYTWKHLGERYLDVLDEAVNPPTTKKLKAMIASPYYPPKIGGLEYYAHNIALELQVHHGWDVFVVTSNHTGNKLEVDKYEGVRVYRLPRFFRFSNTPINPFWPLTIRRIIKLEKPDIINAHTPVPGIADASALASGRTPFVLTYHAATLYKAGNQIANVIIFGYRQFERLMLNKAKAIIVYAPERKDHFSERVKDKFTVIENGVKDSDVLDEPSAKKPNRLVFVNNLATGHEWKGLDQIIRMVKFYNDNNTRKVHLDVVGDGTVREDCEALTIQLGVGAHVTFHGQKTGREKNTIMQRAQALLCYPTTGNDAFPTIIMEAWARFVPVVAADIGPLPHIINDRVDGLLVPANDPVALADSVHDLLNDADLQKKLSVAGWKRVKGHYVWSKLGAKTDTFFRSKV